MSTRHRLLALTVSALMQGLTTAHGITLEGNLLDIEIGVQGRGYGQSSADGQTSGAGALRTKIAYYANSADGKHLFEWVIQGRRDITDSAATRLDIQDLAWLYVADSWELRTGIRKVFWGVTESQNLVDIINQSDLAAYPDGEDKLGQPMINLSLTQLPGILDVFVLIGHRERPFPGRDGRFRGPLLISPTIGYESDAEQNRVDAALRWQFHWHSVDIAISHFSGTARAPQFDEVDNQDRVTTFYPVIDQTGLEIQAILGSWLWKAEWITVSGYERRYSAGTLGLEYTQTGILGSALDLGWVVEASVDDRKQRSPSSNERDILIANRLTFNDLASTTLLAGATIDTQTAETLAVLQAERRIGEQTKVVIEGLMVLNSEPPSTKAEALNQERTAPRYKLAEVSRDSFVQIEWIMYF